MVYGAILVTGPGIIEFGKTHYVTKDSTINAVIPLIRTGGCKGHIEATWSLKDLDKDSTQNSGTVAFDHGEREKILEIPIFGDDGYEKNKSFQLDLSNPTEGATLGHFKKTVVTVVNDHGKQNVTPEWMWCNCVPLIR